MGWRVFPALFLLITAGVKENLVLAARFDSNNIAEKFSDQTVKELESLKNIFEESKNGRDGENMISISKSQISSFSNINGLKSEQKETKNEVDKNGKLIVKVSQKMDVLKNKEEEPKTEIQTEIEIPSKGIHKIIKNDKNPKTLHENNKEFAGLKRTLDEVDKTNIFPKMNYSPYDMAEYIFRTGDEKGVALTIEEFLRERLMSRQEAINFLQSIKYNLDLMQSQYQKLKKVDEKISNKKITKLKHFSVNGNDFVGKSVEDNNEEQSDMEKLKSSDFINDKPDSSDIISTSTSSKQNTYLNKLNLGDDDSNRQDYFEKKNKSYPKSPTASKDNDGGSENDDSNDDIMQKLKMADLLQKEYSLEDVIFELSELMFSESLKNGNTEAQKAMQRFSTYLQNQVDNGQISENLQKKILAVLLSALIDALPKHPELLNHTSDELNMIFDPNLPTSASLKQLITLGTGRLTAQSDSKKKLARKSLTLRKKTLSKRFL